MFTVGLSYMAFIMLRYVPYGFPSDHVQLWQKVQRIDAFELWCRIRLLRAPWTARRSNQSVLRETLNTCWKDWCWSWNASILVIWCKQLAHWKSSWCGERWEQKEKRVSEDEMAGWHHRLDGHEFKWTLGDGDGQGGLACCDSWGCKELDTTEGLSWTEL